MDAESEGEMYSMSGNILDTYFQVVTTMPPMWEYRSDGNGATPSRTEDKE